ncbi:MAG TPA: hypothetical protein VJS92_01240, partial [Candidatus Polarisedimenticolaceae bacterium]|nr:hypothetical protein [Candidatus Polarisedimenticolaceae bacterium]
MPTALDLDLRAPPETRSVQERKFAALLRQVLRGNAFYQQKYAALGFGPERPVGISDLQNLPLLGREELVRDLREHPPYGTNLSFPLGKFVRTSESSSAAGERLVWLDTAESWRWCLERWLDGYRSAGIGAEDRVLVVGGVGAELEAAQLHGALAIPGSSADPCELLQRALSYDVNLLVCSPLDAIALGEAASMAGEPLAQ